MVLEKQSRAPAGVHTRHDLARALTELRNDRGLTVRELAKRAGMSSSTVGGYLSGRHLPTASQLPVFRSLLEHLGVETSDVAAWVDALGRARASGERSLHRQPAPYSGLEPFEAVDSSRFFGRGTETTEILGRLRTLTVDPGLSAGILVVVGPSGSGKSSLLRAGVVAAIEAGESGWTCALITPGSDPVAAFTAACERAQPGRKHVVVIDQFEETFTAHPDPAERHAFLQNLSQRPDDVVLVLGMRADFYATAAAEPVLLGALQHAQFLVGPMSAEHLRTAIVAPARQAGVDVEAGLVELILADLAPRDGSRAAHDAGALPLLSHALLATWGRAVGTRLMIGDYRASGGIDGAVQRTAEDLFTSLDSDAQELARRLFLRLVNLNDDVTVTRRRVSLNELATLDGGDGAAEGVIDEFVDRRLLTQHATSVEISHEALLTAWPRLRAWVDSDRDGLRLHRQVTEGANEWAAAERDPAMLPRGARLESRTEWAVDPDHAAELTVLEHDYLRAAVVQREEARRQARRRTRRLRQLLAAVAVLALVAGGLSVYALRARSAADRQRVAATEARDEALTGQVASEARQLVQSDPALAEQLALVAFDRGSKNLGTLLDLSSRSPITRVLGVQGPTALGVSPDGTVIAVGHSDDGSIHLYRRDTGAVPRALATIPGDASADQQFAIVVLADHRTVISAGEGSAIRIWNIATPTRPTLIATITDSFTGAVQSLAVTPDDRTLAAGSIGADPVQEWDLSNLSSPRSLPAPGGLASGATARAVIFSPDGSELAAAGSPGFVAEWRASTDGAGGAARGAGATGTARPLTRTSDASIYSLAFSADGTDLFDGDRTGSLNILDARNLHAAHAALPGASTGIVNTIAVAADGSRIAAGYSDNTTREWSTTDFSIIGNSNNPGPVTGIDYTPDGRTLMTTAADGTLRLQPALAGYPTPGTTFNLGYSADGSRLATFSVGPPSGAQLWNTVDPASPRRVGSTVTTPGAGGTGALSDDGRSLAIGTTGGAVALFALDDHGAARSSGHPFQALAPRSGVESVAYNARSNLVFVGGDDSTVRVVDVANPAAPHLLATMRTGGAVFNIALSSNGRYLAAASANKKAYLWNIANPSAPRLIATLGGFSSYVYSVAFNPRGDRLAVGSADHSVRVWNVSSPSRPHPVSRPLLGSTDYIWALAYSPDGNTLAAASGDGSVRLYAAGPKLIATPTAVLSSLGGTVFSVAFRPDGNSLVAGGRAATVEQWSLNAHRFARELCPVVGDRLTRAEWSEYVPGAAYDPPCS